MSDDNRIKYFGRRWDSPAFDTAELIDTPVGSTCPCCSEPIEPGDSGLIQSWIAAGLTVHRCAVHIECHLRSVLGSVEHLEGRCSCCHAAGDTDDLPWRESARATMQWLIDARAGRFADHAAPD